MAKSRTADIYRIENLVTGRLYIGVTTAGHGTRWRNHRNELKRGLHPAKAMQADFNAYGIGSFKVTLVEMVADVSMLEHREWTRLSEALENGVILYNNRLPVTCASCGRRFMAKASTRYCERASYPNCRRG